jgi:hypothetical protein
MFILFSFQKKGIKDFSSLCLNKNKYSASVEVILVCQLIELNFLKTAHILKEYVHNLMDDYDEVVDHENKSFASRLEHDTHFVLC